MWGVWIRVWAWQEERSYERRMEGESTGKDNWKQGHLWDELKTEYIGNSQEFLREIPDKTRSIEEHEA